MILFKNKSLITLFVVLFFFSSFHSQRRNFPVNVYGYGSAKIVCNKLGENTQTGPKMKNIAHCILYIILAVPLGKVNAVEQRFGIIRIVLSIDIVYTALINNLIRFDSWSDIFFILIFLFVFLDYLKCNII